MRRPTDGKTAPPDRDELLALLDGATDATLVVDGDWRVHYANRRAATWLTGPGDIPGGTLWEFAPGLADTEIQRMCERAMATGTAGHVEAFVPALGAWFAADAKPAADRLMIYLRERTAERREELATELLADVAATAASSPGTIRALGRATHALQARTESAVGMVWLRDHAGVSRLVACEHDDDRATRTFVEAVRRGGVLPGGLVEQAIESGRPLIVEDLPTHIAPDMARAAGDAGLRAGVYLPLLWPDGVASVICLLTRAGPGHDDWCEVVRRAYPRLSDLAVRMRTRQELSRLFELAREGLCITGADGWFHRVNPELTRMLGRSAEELQSRPFLDFVHPDDRLALATAAQRLLAGGQPEPFEHRAVLPSGEERVLSWTSHAQPDEGLVYSATRDVTTERRREQFETRQRGLLETIALGAPVQDTLHRLLEATEEWFPGSHGSVWLLEATGEFLHVSAAPTLPRDYLEEIGPLPAAVGASVSGEAAASDRTVVVTDISTDARTAGVRDAAARHGLAACWAAPIHGTRGEVLGSFTLYPDHRSAPSRHELEALEDGARLAGVAIAQHVATDALRHSEERFRLLAGAVTDAMWDWDLVDDTLWFNEAFERQFGYTFSENESGIRVWIDNIHDDDRNRVLDSFDRAVRSGRDGWVQEYRFHSRDGSEAVVVDRGSIMRDGNGRAVRAVGGMWDLTAARELEQARERARRLESLGTLAGGMAHDLNNVLAPILLSVELLHEQPALDEDTARVITRIERSARRGADMVGKVLAFARGRQGERLPVDINGLVAEIVEYARNSFGAQVVVETDVPEGIDEVCGDATQLHQVLLNLVVNARDAMPDGGTVTIAAEQVAAPPRTDRGVTPDRRVVRLRVSDTGTGMTDEVRRRVGEPFFTTKTDGRGTGLGLATAMAIVDSHDGAVHVTSTPGSGTTITVELPSLQPDT